MLMPPSNITPQAPDPNPQVPEVGENNVGTQNIDTTDPALQVPQDFAESQEPQNSPVPQDPQPQAKPWFKKIKPFWYWIAGGLLLASVYACIFFTPKQVTLQFGQATCISQLALFPGIQKGISNDFSAKLEGGTSVASTKLCITPSSAPTEGTHTVAFAPLGGWFARKHVTVTVPATPAVKAQTLANQAISTVRPLEIPLTKRDIIYTYQLKVDDKSVPCSPHKEKSLLQCDVSKLALKPDSTYAVTLDRQFQKAPAKTLISDTVTTLRPLGISKVSVENDQTVYTKISDFTITFDTPVAEVQAVLKEKDGTGRTLRTEIHGTAATLKNGEELPRNKAYTLSITKAIGKNGSTLEKPYDVAFTVSGGPKVKSVSIGTSGIAQSGTITLTFDQPIQQDVDVARYISAKGLAATVRRTSDTQAQIAYKNANLCTPFTLTVTKGMRSASNDEKATEDWQFASRITCESSRIIGYSVKGRPLVAYTFGSGATTILFTGAIHGNEPSSYTTMMGWVAHLRQNGYKIPADKRVVIVPGVNPDGVASGARNNARNVNLDRNFPTANWKADIETASGIIKNGGGASALSEPEAKALATLTQQLRPRLEVSFHSQGRLVGANKFGDSVRIGTLYASTVGYKTMFNDAEAVMGYPMTGEYEDWMGETMNLPAILVELPSHSGNYVQSQLGALWKMVLI